MDSRLTPLWNDKPGFLMGSKSMMDLMHNMGLVQAAGAPVVHLTPFDEIRAGSGRYRKFSRFKYGLEFNRCKEHYMPAFIESH